jgi:hypothetical protein
VLLQAQLSGNGQQVIIGGCAVTTGTNCAPGTAVTPTSAYLYQFLSPAASYSNSWTFADGSVAAISANASNSSTLSQTASLASSFTNAGGYGGGEFGRQANQLDTLTTSSTNPANQIGTLWLEIAIQVACSGNSGFGAGGSITIGPAGPGILSGQTWSQNFFESGAQGSTQCGSYVVESGHFQFAFGKQFSLNASADAHTGFGPGNTQARATISRSILGIYRTRL